MENKSKDNIPRLRFPEFVGEWERKKLIEITERITQRNKEDNTNVLTISAQYGLISQLDFFNKSVSSKDLSGYYLLKKNDFAYNKSYSQGYPFGATKRLINYEKGVISTLYICFRNKEQFDNNFAENYFETGITNQEIEKIAQEGARNHGLLNISVSDFFNITISLPTLPEQTRIANFLTAVDEKITKLKKKKELLDQYKKGIMHKVFSQEIRFKDDSGNDFPDWEEKKLGEIIRFLSDYTANGSFASLKENVSYFNQENYAVLVRTTDLEKRVFNPERYTDKHGYNYLKKTSLFGGEIILANVGSIGKIYKVPIFNKPMTLAPNTYVIKFNKDINEDFIFQMMNQQNFTNKLLSMVGSSTLKALNKENLKSIKVQIPFFDEQIKIANFLSAIDEKINKCQSQIEKAELWKKGLLQKMFC